jgi:hypothetical protein
VPDGPRTFDRRQFLANAHAVTAGAWLAGLGLFPATEGIAFAALCVMTAIRWRETWSALADRSIRAPLLLLACLLAWMVAACAWGERGVPLDSALPNRTFLGIAMVVGAAMPTWGLLASISVAGLWWCASALALRADWGRPAILLPTHVSATFLGLSGLAAAGIGCLVGGRGPRLRLVGATALAGAIFAISAFASRGSLIGVVAALAVCLFAASRRRSDWRGPLMISLGIVVIASIALPSMPIWRKASASISREVAALPKGESLSFADVYRLADPARAALHGWTAERALERPLVGHGARTWAADRRRWASTNVAPPQPKASSGSGRRERGPRRVHDSAHSLYLETAYEYGAIGCALLFATIAALVTVAWRASSAVSAMTALAVVSLTVVTGLADLVLNSRPVAARLAATFALVASAGVAARRDPTAESEPGRPSCPKPTR